MAIRNGSGKPRAGGVARGGAGSALWLSLVLFGARTTVPQ